MTFSPRTSWIWDEGDAHPRNAWLLFRRDFELDPAEAAGATLAICADTRYEAWLNGRRLGNGPIRSWPDLLYADGYSLSGAARPGANRLEVLVNHFGLGTCASIEGPAGLIAELVLEDGGGRRRVIGSDSSWSVSIHPGYERTAPKMANGLSWSEVFLADKAAEAANWAWRPAAVRDDAAYRGRGFLPKDIAPLTDEPIYPAALLSLRRVARRGFVRSVNLRPLAFPGQLDLNKHKVFRGFIGFALWADGPLRAELSVSNDPHDSPRLRLNLNGRVHTLVNGAFARLDLEAGKNWALANVSGMFHDPEFHLVFDLPEGCRLQALFEGDAGSGGPEDGSLCFIGPFGATSQVQAGSPLRLELPPDGDFERLLAARRFEELLPYAPHAASLGPDLVSVHHVALDSLYQRVLSELPVPQELRLVCRPNAGDQASAGIEVHPGGADSELVLDFGRELTGYLEFELEAKRGAIVDFFCYESQHDGLVEHTFSLNNSLRYVCREGRQRYRSPTRRGFRYCKLTVRCEDGPLSLLELRLNYSTYPVTATGGFRSSDSLLDRIWELCRHTLRICMEDTFVDCPAYEQALWTGDSYTSSLYSHYLFGSYEFPAHGNRLIARSLERSVLAESTVPSAWQNVIPNWSFLWVQSCVDHYLYSGDAATFSELFPALMATMRGTEPFIAREGKLAGLFAIDAWNFIDWAALDSPDSGAVAHQNAILAWTLRILADAARMTGRLAEAEELASRSQSLARAIDAAFWSDERQAYIDSIHADGTRSESFSLHSQLFMYLAGCGSADRRRIVAGYLAELPEGFTDIASPFVRLFHFKALLETGNPAMGPRVFAYIREIWGHMLKMGATTAWEGWSFIPGHYTRSHCHAWSSSPAYFIGAHLIGLRPLEPGFARALFSPRFDSLSWFEGAVPTPYGRVEVKAGQSDCGWELSVEAPPEVELVFDCPPGFRAEGIAEGGLLIPDETGELTRRYAIRLRRA